MNKDEVRAQFSAIVAQKENRIELDRATLLIAAEEYPQLDIESYLRQLDHFAEQFRTRDQPNSGALKRIEALSLTLSGDLGFHGNAENYYDARNSFLNDVIDRRTGIPITLSVIYLEVARRAGLKLFGVGLPGHFIIKFVDGNQQFLIDPFNGGRLLLEEECHELIRKMYGEAAPFQPEFLRAVTKKQMLTRMLQNLKGIYAQAADHHKLLGIIERALAIAPDSAVEMRDRGLVYFGMERYVQALDDLEHYLRVQPQARDAEEVKEKIKHLKRGQAQLN